MFLFQFEVHPYVHSYLYNKYFSSGNHLKIKYESQEFTTCHHRYEKHFIGGLSLCKCEYTIGLKARQSP